MTSLETIFENCWYFIRGDTPEKEFEKWVYETPELEELFSEDFYMTLISTDYSMSGPVFILKEKLEEAIRGLITRDCYCHTLPNLADVGMGEHNHIMQSFEEKASYGDPLWWLHLEQCSVCKDFWMVGSEERINDVFIMKRMLPVESHKIINESLWPDDFKKFATLLRIGRERGHSVRFINPVSPALVSTVIDLAIAEPGIKTQELSELLQISLLQTEALISEARKETRGRFINITHD